MRGGRGSGRPPGQSGRPDDRRLPERVKRALRVRRGVGEQVSDDVEDEIRFHLESRIGELEAAGHDPAEARRVAMEEFGDVDAARRALGRESSRRERTVRGAEWLEQLVRDLRFGGRQLRGSPGFTVSAVLTLALGIGATTAIFSAVHAVLLRPLPYPQPDGLVRVWETAPEGAMRNVVSAGNYLDWRERAESFAEIGAHEWPFGGTMIDEGGEASRLRLVRITPSALDALGTAPALGRRFTAEESASGGPAVVLVSHEFWRQRLGGDPSAVGSALTVDGRPLTVVGVMPPGFDYPHPDVDAWLAHAFSVEDEESRRSHQWTVVARLADGVSVERAQAEMDGVVAGITEEHPGYMTGWGANVVPLRGDLVGEVRALLWVLMGVVGLVLLLTCVNLANLLLARATGRGREVAVRGALGADRARLVRQLLVESLLLGVLGGGLALAVVVGGLDTLVALAPDDIPLLDDVRIDPVVLGFAVVTTLLATLLFGLVPALRATATSPSDTLRGSRGSSDDASHARLRSGLLVAEVALAVVLVVGAGLLLRSMARLNAVDPGVETETVLTAFIDLSTPRYEGSADHAAFFDALTRRLEAAPGVRSVSGSTAWPMSGFGSTFSFLIEGRPAETPSGYEEDERMMAVLPDYFETLSIPVLEGRGISDADRASARPVAVISQALARKQWPDGDAVGSRIRFNPDMDWLEIVGIVDDVRMDGLDRDTPPAIYIAYDQKPFEWMAWLGVVIRTDGDPTTAAPLLRAAVRDLDATLVPESITTLDDAYAESTARRRFATVLLGAFAALALVLGALGIYGLLAYSVSQRRQEIGIRMALGAEPGRLAGSVVRDAVAIAAVGVTLGGAAALVGSRALQSLLYEVEPTDPVTFAAACAALLALAAGAAWLPARSATRIDPVAAIRDG